VQTFNRKNPIPAKQLYAVMSMNTSPSELENFLKLLPQTPIMIPILANDKKPDIPTGKSWKDKQFHLTPQQALDRLRQGKNVGVVANDWLVIIDLDNPTKFTLPIKTLTVMTRNGKLHQFYKNYGDVENSVGKNELAKCGEVRAEWQYVLSAGSYVPSTDSAGSGLYHIIDGLPLAVLAKKDLPSDFIPTHSEQMINSEALNKPISLRNKFGWALEDLRARDDKLNTLLNNNSSGYPSESEADMATLTKLLFWGFDDGEAVTILKQYRFRPKLNRQEYVTNTLSHISRTNKIEDSVDVKKWNPKTGYILDLGEGKAKPLPNGSLDLDSIRLDLEKQFIFKTPKDIETLYFYKDGIYEPAEQMIKSLLGKNLGAKATIHMVQEILEHLKWNSFIDREQFNKYNGYIPVENSLLNLETGERKDFTPEEIFTFKIPMKYDKTADCPKFKKWLSEVQTPDNILTLQEYFGYCLIPELPFHISMWFIGGGRNGKGTLIRTLEDIVGKENCCYVPVGLLSGDRNFCEAEFYGKLVNISSEPSVKKEFETPIFQKLTGDDYVQAEVKLKQKRISFRSYAKFFIIGNRYPKVHDITDAFRERIIVMKWMKQYKAGEGQIKHIERTWLKDETERSGILNWMLEGLQRLMKNDKFTLTATQREMMLDFERASDSIAAWIHDRLEITKETKDNYHTREDLVKDYMDYCEEWGIFTCKNNTVYERLRNTPKIRETRITINKKQERVWSGLKLKPQTTDDSTNTYNNNNLNNFIINKTDKTDKTDILDSHGLGDGDVLNGESVKTLSNRSNLSKLVEILEIIRLSEPNRVFTTDVLVKLLLVGGGEETIQGDLAQLVKDGLLLKSGENYKIKEVIRS